MFEYIFSPKNINLTKAAPFHINSHLTSCNLTKNSAGQKTLEIKPDYAEAHKNLEIALARKGKVDEAIFHFRKAIWIRPYYKEAYNNLQVALAQLRNR